MTDPIPHPPTTQQHPLDPLSAAEIDAARSILLRERQSLSDVRFVSITLDEPPKSRILAYRRGREPDRRVKLVLRSPAERAAYEAVVSLTDRSICSFHELDNEQPALMLEEVSQAEVMVKCDDRWISAVRRRGIANLDEVIVEPTSLGYTGPEDAARAGRGIRMLTFLRGAQDENPYARPLEGIIAHVDLDEMKVVSIEDHGVVPPPPVKSNYRPDQIHHSGNYPYFGHPERPPVKPLNYDQPDGPSYQVDGYEVSWQKWRLRVGFSTRESLVLYNIRYEDAGRSRSILYRASLCELFVPYGDGRPTRSRINVFDIGEIGLGLLTNSLSLGCDCVGTVHYWDAYVNDNRGYPVRIENAICMHEEDYGLLWKHSDSRTGNVEVRRSRRLVISCIATAGNYDYALYWYFYQDGSIQFEVKLTGIALAGSLRENELPKYGSMMAPQIYGSNHQHIFCARLDLMIDGLENTVSECDSVLAAPGPDNEYGNTWIVTSTPLRTESEGMRAADAAKWRYWKFQNPERLNRVGQPVGYRLHPQNPISPMFQDTAHALARGRFATKQLWVTAYDPNERYPAGDYPNQCAGNEGLPRYAAAGRSIESTDIVAWHVFASHHVTRPEDWPVMPVTTAGFRLDPDGFFDGNPALDVPPPGSCEV